MANLYELPTGFDGKDHWKKIRQVVSSIQCDHCNREGHKLIDFAEDFVRVKTRRPPKKYSNYMAFKRRICAMEVKNSKICRLDRKCNL